MKYWVCDDCGEIFSEEDAKAIRIDTGERVIACPSCRSPWMEEADICIVCGEPIVPDSVKICTECAETLHKEWVNFVEKVMDRRLKENNGLSADYLDCEQAALDFLDEVGII